MPSVAGFWSYTHSDNANDEGGILALADRLRAEYELLTAESLELFIDQSDLLWGDDWREKIAQALERVTFFIPIVTPAYFRSPECRKELLRFAREAREHGAEKLILPVYYISVPEIEGDEVPADEAMAIVKPLQRQDLRQLRLQDRNSSAYRTLVNGLAERIIDVARHAERRDDLPPPEGLQDLTPPSHPPGKGGDDLIASEVEESEEEFLLETMAKGETAMGRIQEPMEAIAQDIRDLGELTAQATTEIEESDAAGKPAFATRLAVAKRLASRLSEPAQNLEAHAKDFVSLMWDLDPFVTGLLKEMRGWTDEEDLATRETFFEGVEGLHKASQESSVSIAELVKSLEENSNFSRELRHPLRVYQTGLRNILDAQSVINQWWNEIQDIDNIAP